MRSVANYVANVAVKNSFGSYGPSAIGDTGVLGLGVMWGGDAGHLNCVACTRGAAITH
ncbi:hypothetical protein BW43_01249 [Pseudomonas sp. RIT357]|nr:hypothetical protein BW43_01249 [Pseudomonas sp. RIT357]